MKLNEKLHLVIPLYDHNDVIYAYVHAAPISREVFEAHFLLISKAFAAIHGEGLGEIAGPRVAGLVLREVAKRQRDEVGAQALLNEIRRLSNVLTRASGVWEMMPFQDAIDHASIDADDAAEVENALVFFTVVSAMHRKQILQQTLPGAARLWGAQTSSLACTAFAASLKTSTEIDNTGATPKAGSSVPY